MDQPSRTARDRIRTSLSGLGGRVVLSYSTSDVDSWYSRVERALLDEIAGGSAAITLEVHAGRWDPASEAAVGIRRTPCIAIAGTRDTGILEIRASPT